MRNTDHVLGWLPAVFQNVSERTGTFKGQFLKRSREGNCIWCFFRCADSNRNILNLQKGYLVDEVRESIHCR